MRNATRSHAALMVVAALVAIAPVRAAPQPAPPDLSRLMERARIEGPASAWCRGLFAPGRPAGYAVAVSGPTGGRYLALDSILGAIDLATFTGAPDLACYSAAEAADLNRALQRSETVQGRLAPRWPTGVVCGFVEPTRAVCWQYSARSHAFVEVGGWTT